MDNNQDMIRFSPATKRHLQKSPSVSEKSRKERFQKLSLIGTRVNPEIEMGSDQENEHIISMLAAKRFKLPRKFLDEDHASVPRKLRSAMKKRSGSLSPPLQDSKKMKHQPRGRDSPKKETVKKVKKKQKLKQKRMEHAKSTRANGSITKDEEEVVETLYALSGMFIADGSSQDPPSTINGATERTKIEGIHEGSLGKDAAEAINSKPKTEEQIDMIDNFEEAKGKNTDLLTATEPSRENLMIRLNVDSRPMAINLEHQHKAEDHNRECASLSPPKCPVLWPGLLTASRNSMDASLRCSSNRESSESCYSTEKTCKTTVGKVLRKKKCIGHVYISRMIRTLQNPDSKDGLSLLNGREEEEPKQGIVEVGPGLAVLQNGGNGRLSGSHVGQIDPTEKQRFEFLSLVHGSGTMMPQFQVPYLQSYHQHRIPITHPAHKIHYSNPYPDQLSTASSHQLQLPTYQVGSSGRSSLQKGPTWEHQQAVRTVSQIASSQYKHLGSPQVAQFPGWQNGRDESSAAMHDLMTQYNRNHHRQQQLQQQRYAPLRSSMAGPSHRGSFL